MNDIITNENLIESLNNVLKHETNETRTLLTLLDQSITVDYTNPEKTIDNLRQHISMQKYLQKKLTKLMAKRNEKFPMI